MQDIGFTTINIRQINKNKVYNYIYQKKNTFKLQISRDLQMGLSTVNQNIKTLEDEGLIERNGFFDSTGGRKAQAIHIVPEFKIAIGIGILKNCIYITAVNLYGEAVHQKSFLYSYADSSDYYRQVAHYLQEFLLEYQIPDERILGISIATQGIISSDGQSISYGNIMGNENMKLSDFVQHLSYPCYLIHDSKAAGALELWNHKNLKNAIVFLLNENLGGALIINGTVHQGNHMQSGLLEHLCINPSGPLCYCGKNGCLETYCSINALENASSMRISEFFQMLRNSPSPDIITIWKDYLNHLAFAIRNLNIILDGDIVISGYLAPFLTDDDIDYLLNHINQLTPFPLKKEQIILGLHGQYTPAIGGTLAYITDFLASV